jgi:hypothetical protein
MGWKPIALEKHKPEGLTRVNWAFERVNVFLGF